jgi:L-ascorbate metabolism protein UlaG (beta-lactamase superfamily)
VLQLGNRPVWYVGLGLGQWFRDQDITNVKEMDWWQSAEHSLPSGGKVTVTATPCQHWSARTPFDRMKTLWCSWHVQGPHSSFFFAGDTAMCPAFQQIRKRVGAPTVAAIPIGAYLPRDFMRHHHVSPEDAVQIHEDLGAQWSVGCHWGTLRQKALEHVAQPPRDLAAELERRLRASLCLTSSRRMPVQSKGTCPQGLPRLPPPPPLPAPHASPWCVQRADDLYARSRAMHFQGTVTDRLPSPQAWRDAVCSPSPSPATGTRRLVHGGSGSCIGVSTCFLALCAMGLVLRRVAAFGVSQNQSVLYWHSQVLSFETCAMPSGRRIQTRCCSLKLKQRGASCRLLWAQAASRSVCIASNCSSSCLRASLFA